MIGIFCVLLFLESFAVLPSGTKLKKDELGKYSVTYGSTIKLQHVQSKHRLHSHDVVYGLLLKILSL